MSTAQITAKSTLKVEIHYSILNDYLKLEEVACSNGHSEALTPIRPQVDVYTDGSMKFGAMFGSGADHCSFCSGDIASQPVIQRYAEQAYVGVRIAEAKRNS
jgi:hypothetical protein